MTDTDLEPTPLTVDQRAELIATAARAALFDTDCRNAALMGEVLAAQLGVEDGTGRVVAVDSLGRPRRTATGRALSPKELAEELRARDPFSICWC